MNRITLNDRELAAVLAALLHWQETYKECGAEEAALDFEEHFADCPPLTLGEIDDLCVRINTDVHNQPADWDDDDSGTDEWEENA